MASLQFRNGVYRLLFWHNDKQHTLSIGDVSLTEARQWKFRTENLLMRVKQRLLEVPASVREEAATRDTNQLLRVCRASSRPGIACRNVRRFFQSWDFLSLEHSFDVINFPPTSGMSEGVGRRRLLRIGCLTGRRPMRHHTFAARRVDIRGWFPTRWTFPAEHDGLSASASVPPPDFEKCSDSQEWVNRRAHDTNPPLAQ